MKRKNKLVRNVKEFFVILKENVPILYLCLVCIGFIEKGLFYHQFGINILDYLDIQEMIFMFVPIGSFIIALAFYFLLAIVPIYMFENENKLIGKEKDKEQPKASTEKSKINKAVRKVLFMYLILAPLFIFFYLSVVLFNRYIGIDFLISPIIILVPMLLYVTIILIMIAVIRKDKSTTDRFRKISVGMLSSVVVIFSISILLRIGRANSILAGNPEYSISFEMEGRLKPIETNESLVYIGQTSNNIFLRNLKTNSTEIFFIKNLNRITLQKIIND